MDELKMNVGEVELDDSAIEASIKNTFETRKKLYKVIYPAELETNSYSGDLFGYRRSDNGVFVVLGYDGNMPNEALHTEKIGAVDKETQANELKAVREDGVLKFTFDVDGEEVELQKDSYSLVQNIFSRNSGIMETDWLSDKSAVIVGCGSVGCIFAMQLARSGVGNFVLIDTDIMEMHNVCRHQCNLTDVGRYKVDALGDRILQINPTARIKKFINIIQNVPIDDYKDFVGENSIIISGCDNRIGNAFASDIAYQNNSAFLSVGFWQRASVGEIFFELPERGHKCYRCSLEGPIKASQEDQLRNRFYMGEEEKAKANFEPGISVDIEYVTTIATKLVLDILNRKNDKYTQRLLPVMQQYTLICNTNDEKVGGEQAAYLFDEPLEIMKIIPKGTDNCEICGKLNK